MRRIQCQVQVNMPGPTLQPNELNLIGIIVLEIKVQESANELLQDLLMLHGTNAK